MRTTIEQAADILRKMAGALEGELSRAEIQNAQQAKKEAIRLSKGKISAAQLKRMGHPYARGRHRFVRGLPLPAEPYIINQQQGQFLRSWTVLNTTRRGKALITILRNTAPYSGFMRGTRLMIPRPIDEEVMRRIKSPRFKRTQTLLRRAINPRRYA